MDLQDTMKFYIDLMRQIRARHQALCEAFEHSSDKPPWSVNEFCQLQIRLICETLAVACFVAHGDVEGTKSAKLSGQYRADKLMNALERLNPRSYPVAANVVLNDRGMIASTRPEQPLPKARLLESYRRADEFMHYGRLGDALRGEKKNELIVPVSSWSDDLINHLRGHFIVLSSMAQFLVWFEGEEVRMNAFGVRPGKPFDGC